MNTLTFGLMLTVRAQMSLWKTGRKVNPTWQSKLSVALSVPEPKVPALQGSKIAGVKDLNMLLS